MDSIDIQTWNNDNFAGNYTSPFISEILGAYPGAGWRMQVRATPDSSVVAYQFATGNLVNSFAGRIAIVTGNLIFTAPLAEMQALQAGTYAYDLRCEDAASGAVITAVEGNFVVTEGVSRVSDAVVRAVPALIPTAIFRSQGVIIGPAFAVPMQLPTLTVAELNSQYPPSSSIQNMRSGVNDALSPTWLQPLTGGGAAFSPALCDGTNWVAG